MTGCTVESEGKNRALLVAYRSDNPGEYRAQRACLLTASLDSSTTTRASGWMASSQTKHLSRAAVLLAIRAPPARPLLGQAEADAQLT